jgi:hypothetical protein
MMEISSLRPYSLFLLPVLSTVTKSSRLVPLEQAYPCNPTFSQDEGYHGAYITAKCSGGFGLEPQNAKILALEVLFADTQEPCMGIIERNLSQTMSFPIRCDCSIRGVDMKVKYIDANGDADYKTLSLKAWTEEIQKACFITDGKNNSDKGKEDSMLQQPRQS